MTVELLASSRVLEICDSDLELYCKPMCYTFLLLMYTTIAISIVLVCGTPEQNGSLLHPLNLKISECYT